MAPRVAIEAGLKTFRNRFAQMVDLHGNEWKADSTQVARLEMQGFAIEGLHAIVQTEEHRKIANSPISDGGVMGIRVFRDVALELDFEKHTVAVSRLEALEMNED